MFGGCILCNNNTAYVLHEHSFIHVVDLRCKIYTLNHRRGFIIVEVVLVGLCTQLLSVALACDLQNGQI